MEINSVRPPRRQQFQLRKMNIILFVSFFAIAVIILEQFSLLGLALSSTNAAVYYEGIQVFDGNTSTNKNGKDDGEEKLSTNNANTNKGNLNFGDSSCASKCMNLDYGGGMDDILQNTKQVFVTMPAKAAGTSMKEFTTKCMKYEVPDNFVNRVDLTKEFLTDSFHLPSIITSHLYNGDAPMMDLAKHGNRQTLIIYIHREETDRLLSAIKHVTTSGLCDPRYRSTNKLKNIDMKKFHIERNETHCTLDEGPVVHLIESGFEEIGFGSSKIFTCDAFDAIEQNAPNMVFIDYKQANKLQKLLAKHHCPELLTADEEWHPIEANAASEKGRDIYLRLRKGRIVPLDEWLHEKKHVIEYALKMKQGASCQGKIRHMEDDLFACKDKVIQATPKNLKCW